MKKPILIASQQDDILWPSWWHHHGSKITLQHHDKNLIKLSGSAASLAIEKVGHSPARFSLKWSITHSRSNWVMGQVEMDSCQLAAAFGLSDESGDFGDWLIERYRADSAEQRLWIRYGNQLNIPGPGTGHDGDPNISIELDGDIKKAVVAIIG